MNFIKCEKLEKSMAELQFSIDAEAFKGAVADVFKKEGKKYSVPGFRKGKAPRSLIEKMYGADVFTYDAINELFPAAYEEAVKAAGIEPVGRPEVSVDSASEAEGATLTVKVAVMPEVKVGNYNGLTVEKTVHTVSDEAVEAELKRVQERNARELTREGAAENGDIVDIDFEGFVDGVAFEGGKAEHYSLTLGSGSFIPGFEDGLIDVIPALTSKESPVTVKATFPKDYGKEELDGKEATFYVVVEYAVQYTLPEFNREFVEKTLKYTAKKDVYTSDAEYLQEYITYIRQQLESKIADQVSYAKTDALWTYLTGKAVCRNLPQSEIDFYYDSYLSQIKSAYSQYSTYYGENFTKMYPDEAHFSVWYMGLKSAETWKEELKQLSVRLVKKDMITHAIAEKENMETVTDEEYKKVVEYWVQQYSGQMTSAEIVKSMGELYLRQSALADRMSDWLMQHATFTYDEEGN